MCVFRYHYLEKIVHNLCTTFSQGKRIQQVFKAANNARNVPVNQAFYEYTTSVLAFGEKVIDDFSPKLVTMKKV